MGQVVYFGRSYPIDCMSLNNDPRWTMGITGPVRMRDAGNTKGAKLSGFENRSSTDQDALIMRLTSRNPTTCRREIIDLKFRCNGKVGSAEAGAAVLKAWFRQHASLDEISGIYMRLIDYITRNPVCKKYWQG